MWLFLCFTTLKKSAALPALLSRHIHLFTLTTKPTVLFIPQSFRSFPSVHFRYFPFPFVARPLWETPIWDSWMAGEFVWGSSVRTHTFYQISTMIVHSFVVANTLAFTAVCWNSFWLHAPFPIYFISAEIEPRSKAGNTSTGKIGTGRETLRLRSKGPATVEEVVCYVRLVLILLGHVAAFMVVRAEKKGKAMRFNTGPYIPI